jgi:hypothetical protein
LSLPLAATVSRAGAWSGSGGDYRNIVKKEQMVGEPLKNLLKKSRNV